MAKFKSSEEGSKAEEEAQQSTVNKSDIIVDKISEEELQDRVAKGLIKLKQVRNEWSKLKEGIKI